MATPPDFSVGQVLTAAHMDAVGLWKITPSAVSGTGVTVGAKGAVILTAAPDPYITCFSSDFRNYRIIGQLTAFQGGAQAVAWRPANGTTPNTTAANYRNAGADQAWANGTILTNFNNGTSAQFGLGRVDGTGQFSNFVADIFCPFSSTERTNHASNYRDAAYYGWTGGSLTVTTSYDTINIRLNGTNTMTGTIEIYGYN